MNLWPSLHDRPVPSVADFIGELGQPRVESCHARAGGALESLTVELLVVYS